MYQVHNPTIFLGWQVYLSDFEVDISHGDASYYRYRETGAGPGEYAFGHLIRDNIDITYISFSLMAYGSHSRDAIHHFLHILRYNPKLIQLLGPGYVCHHCGSVNMSGTVRCVWCGGLVKEKDWSAPIGFDFHMPTMSKDSMIRSLDDEDRPTETRIEMMSDNIDIDKLFLAIVGQAPSMILPTGCETDPEYYLCQKCGGSVRIGDLCPGCGGQQIPLSEIIKMDRRCAFCGTATKGDIVCRSCGARVSGETYKRWMKQHRPDLLQQRNKAQRQKLTH